MMSYRGRTKPNDYSRLADWMFFDQGFPKHETNYNNISNYLESVIPFPNALSTFDELWEVYLLKLDS